MKLIVIIPLGLMIFFCGSFYACLHDFIWPRYQDLRWISFGIMWFQLIAIIWTAIGAWLILMFVPWNPFRQN